MSNLIAELFLRTTGHVTHVARDKVLDDLHTIVPGPLECTCWRQFAEQWGDWKKALTAPLNAIIIIVIIIMSSNEMTTINVIPWTCPSPRESTVRQTGWHKWLTAWKDRDAERCKKHSEHGHWYCLKGSFVRLLSDGADRMWVFPSATMISWAETEHVSFSYRTSTLSPSLSSSSPLPR